MKILEPKSVDVRQIKKTNNKKLMFIVLTILFLVILLVVLMNFKSNNSVDNIFTSSEDNSDVKVPTENLVQEEPKTGLRTFSGNEFRLLYDNFLLPNTEKVGSPPYITGDDIADARIRQLSESRGYKLRTSPLSGLPLIDNIPLQETAHTPWKNLQSAAKKVGLVMTLTSGYRTVEDQRELFLGRLSSEGVSVSAVSNGTADNAVISILTKASAPGYSKHHSGYTIDIKCEGWEFENFKNSKCNEWLVTNNYENAKLHGYIPSYPLGADLQGPDPEAWEYVYVGQEVLNY